MFCLQKYYFDVVSNDGEYAASCWGPLQLPWLAASYSELSSSLIAKPSSRLQLRGAASPLQHRAFAYADSRNRLNAKWKPVWHPPRMSYANDVLRWELLQLRSRVTLHRNSSALLVGSGYGESVSWLVPPWSLGIRKLRWGRYLSESAFLMWMIAEGASPLQYGIVDQSEFDEVAFVDGEIRVGDATLRIGPRKSIVSEGDIYQGKSLLLKLVSGLVFGGQPRILQRKAIFKCLFSRSGIAQESGYAVSEILWFDP